LNDTRDSSISADDSPVGQSLRDAMVRGQCLRGLVVADVANLLVTSLLRRDFPNVNLL